MMEGMIGLIHVLTRRFITNNYKIGILKSHNSISKNMLKLCFVCELCSVRKTANQQFRFYQINFCLYIVKGWRDTPMNLI